MQQMGSLFSDCVIVPQTEKTIRHRSGEFADPMFCLSPSKDLDAEVDKLFQFYRVNGYPAYSPNSYRLRREYRKLKRFDESSLLDGKNIKQNMLGCGVLWTYHPHWIEVVCAGEKQSLKELWNDDEKLKMLIRKTYLWKLKHGELSWTHNRIRQNAKVFLSKQSVSNFRPTVAKLIYNTYGNMGGGIGYVIRLLRQIIWILCIKLSILHRN